MRLITGLLSGAGVAAIALAAHHLDYRTFTRAGIAILLALEAVPVVWQWGGARAGVSSVVQRALTPLHLDVLPGALAVTRLPPDALLEGGAAAAAAFGDGPLLCVTTTRTETSLVTTDPPPSSLAAVPGIRSEGGWRALRVAGPLDFALVGILASLTAALAAAGISVFAISTFDTDYILVRAKALPEAVAALVGAGHTVGEA